MSDEVLRLLRGDLPPPSPFAVAERPHRAKLDQNESALPLPDELRARIEDTLRTFAWHRYPQPARYHEVKARFAAAVGQPAERVALTAGGDQTILCAYWLAGGLGRRARIFEPTYPMFAHYAALTQTELDRVILGPDLALAAHGTGAPVDLFCVVSPNNPTGTLAPRALIRAALRYPQLVFVDEAYRDFAGEDCAELLGAHPNLLLGRSLSKAGLAAARLGYLVGHPAVIAAAERTLFAPYHLSAFQLAAAWHMDELAPLLRARAEATAQERERVAAAMAALGRPARPSRGNFLLFDAPDAAAVFERLLAAGVRIRNVSGLPGLGAHLRVTIGAPEENDLFLEALRAC